jgi:hypothetical protein
VQRPAAAQMALFDNVRTASLRAQVLCSKLCSVQVVKQRHLCCTDIIKMLLRHEPYSLNVGSAAAGMPRSTPPSTAAAATAAVPGITYTICELESAVATTSVAAPAKSSVLCVFLALCN